MKKLVLDFLEGPGRDVVTTAELRRLGCGRQVLRTLERERAIVRVARGAYVRAAALAPGPEEVRASGRAAVAERAHLLRLDAILRSYGARVAASHHSAALAWGLPTTASTLHRVHVVHTSPGRTTRRHDAFTVHRCDDHDVLTRHGGRRLVTPALAVVGTALTSGLIPGVMTMDGALRARLTTREDLAAQLERMRHTPGLVTARRALELADGLAESPGETRLRILLTRLGIRFLAQHWIRTRDGRRHARVDFYLPDHGVVLEFDGEVKYGGQQGRANLAAEKAREDDLRRDGFGVGRVVWSQLTAAGVRRVVEAAREQALPHARHRTAEPPAWA